MKFSAIELPSGKMLSAIERPLVRDFHLLSYPPLRDIAIELPFGKIMSAILATIR